MAAPRLGDQRLPVAPLGNIVFVHTNETFKDIYVEDGVYSMDAVTRFSHVCRDFRANEDKLLDPRLMDLLFVLHWKYCKQQISIFSGYRSAPRTRISKARRRTRSTSRRVRSTFTWPMSTTSRWP